MRKDCGYSRKVSHIGTIFVIYLNNFIVLNKSRKSSCSVSKAFRTEISSNIKCFSEYTTSISYVWNWLFSTKLLCELSQNKYIINSNSIYFLDTSCLQIFWSLNVFWNMLAWANWSKCTWETNKNVLSLKDSIWAHCIFSPFTILKFNNCYFLFWNLLANWNKSFSKVLESSRFKKALHNFWFLNIL